MLKWTTVGAAACFWTILIGVAAFAQIEEGGESAPSRWTISSPMSTETYAYPLTSLGVGGGHSPEGVAAYVCKIRAHGWSSAVFGSVGGNCNQDGSWANTVTFSSSPAANMYEACIFPAGGAVPDEFAVFYIVE